MNEIINKTGNVIQKIIWGILVAMFGILSIFNILGTTKIDIKVNGYKEYAEYSLNNILMIILYVVTIFAILYIIDRYTKLLKMDTKKFANIATIYVIVIGIAYIVMARAYPISDQSVVQRIASSFLDGDYSELTGEGYLVAYPQQLGIIGIIQIIYYIFGKDNYIAIMLFNVLAMAGIFNMLYKILTKMTDNIRIHNLYWVMVFGCFPLIFYSFFVYGTIFGLFFSLVGFYNLILAKENGKILNFVISFLAFCMGTISKSNCLIFVIAAVLVTLFYGIKEQKLKYVVFSIILMGALMAPKCVNLYYAKKANVTISKGVPAKCFIAMGLQKGTKELGCGVDGWYNAYNLTTFINAGRDSEKASEIAGENISERLSEFKSKPLEFVDFAKNKITTQWCEPTFQTFWMLQAMDNHAEWSKVAESIEKGKANKIIFVIMKLYLIFIWLGNLAYLIAKRKQLTIWNLLLQVAVLGGFIFHFLWEGKALYIMPYYVISFVAGVQGMYMLYEKIKIETLNIQEQNKKAVSEVNHKS